jgi:hypothetical protein
VILKLLPAFLINSPAKKQNPQSKRYCGFKQEQSKSETSLLTQRAKEREAGTLVFVVGLELFQFWKHFF